MIILTSKRREELKEEIREELKQDITQDTIKAMADVFQSVFASGNAIAFVSEENRLKLQADLHDIEWNRLWAGLETDQRDSIRHTLARAACSIASILDYKVKEQYKDQVAQFVSEYVQDEGFVDDIVNRINRKQLIGGGQ